MKKIMSYDEFKAIKCANCDGIGFDGGCGGCLFDQKFFGEKYARYLKDAQLRNSDNYMFEEFCVAHDFINPTDEDVFECEDRGYPCDTYDYFPEHNLVLINSTVCDGAMIMTKGGAYVDIDPDMFKSYTCFPPIKKRKALFNFADIVRDGDVYDVKELCPDARVHELYTNPDDPHTFAGYYVELPHNAWKYFE